MFYGSNDANINSLSDELIDSTKHIFNSDETNEVKLFIEQETLIIGDKSLRVQVDEDPYTILLSNEMVDNNFIDYLRRNLFTYQ